MLVSFFFIIYLTIFFLASKAMIFVFLFFTITKFMILLRLKSIGFVFTSISIFTSLLERYS